MAATTLSIGLARQTLRRIAQAASLAIAGATPVSAMVTTAHAGEVTMLWQTTFEPEAERDGRIYDIAVAPDGGYCLVGTFANRIADEWDRKADVWALRLDPRGEVIWDRTFDHGDDESGSKTVATGNRGCVVGAGEGRALSNVWIFEVNGRGDIVWEQRFGGQDHDTVDGLAAVDDGIVVLGNALPYPDHPGVRIPYWIARVNADGVRWQISPDDSVVVHRPPEDEDRDSFPGNLQIADLDNGHAVISGPFANPGSDLGYGSVEVASDGAIVWSAKMGRGGWPYAFAALPQVGYAVAWFDLAADTPLVDLTRFDTEGRELWRTEVALFDDAHPSSAYGAENARLSVLADGSIVLIVERDFGRYKIQNRRHYTDYWLLRFDRGGTLRTRQVLVDDRPAGVETRSRLTDMTETADGTIVITGSTTWPGAHNKARRVDVWLRKVTLH